MKYAIRIACNVYECSEMERANDDIVQKVYPALLLRYCKRARFDNCSSGLPGSVIVNGTNAMRKPIL